MHNPFEGCVEGLKGYETNGNFIQNSTCMCVEHSFKILKERCRIIMRKVDISLRHMTYIVVICIVLYNMCTANLI